MLRGAKMRMLMIGFAVLLLMFSFGCEKSQTTKGPYIGGSAGLDISFVEGSPPDTVFDDDSFPFPITIRMENKGETNVAEGDIVASLSGIDPKLFQLDAVTKKNVGTLGKIQKENEQMVAGGRDEISFDAKGYKEKLNVPSYSTAVQADICYKYTAEGVSSLCVKNDLRKKDESDPCLVSESKVVSTSGAPVHIKDLRQEPKGANLLSIKFNVEKVGAGGVYSPSLLGRGVCSEDRDTKDKFYLSVAVTGLEPKCSVLGGKDSGEIKLFEGKRFVECTVDTKSLGDTAIMKPINIRAEYVYKDKVMKNMMVEPSIS